MRLGCGSFKARFVLVLVALVACAEAGGTVTGGEVTQAGTIATVSPVFISPCKGPPGAEFRDDGDAGAVTWKDLYRDLFGPTGRPGSCTFGASCHGASDQKGWQATGGLQCPDSKACFDSMRALRNGEEPPVPYVKPGNPNGSHLLTGLLRVCRNHEISKTATITTNTPFAGPPLPADAGYAGTNGTGYMPDEPRGFVFPKKSIDRVAQWIANGANDD